MLQVNLLTQTATQKQVTEVNANIYALLLSKVKPVWSWANVQDPNMLLINC